MRTATFLVGVIVGSVLEPAVGFLPTPLKPSDQQRPQDSKGRMIQADKWMTPEPSSWDFGDIAASIKQTIFQIDDAIQESLSPLQTLFNFTAVTDMFESMTTPLVEPTTVMTAMDGPAVLEKPSETMTVSESSPRNRWASEPRRRGSSYGRPPRRDDDEKEEEPVAAVDDSPDTLIDRGVQYSDKVEAGATPEEPAMVVTESPVKTTTSRWRTEEERRPSAARVSSSPELTGFISAVTVEEPVAEEVVMSASIDTVEEEETVEEPVMAAKKDYVDYPVIVIPADAFPSIDQYFEKQEEEEQEVLPASPVMAAVVPEEPVAEEAAPVEKEEVAVVAEEPVQEEKPVFNIHELAAKAKAEEEARLEKAREAAMVTAAARAAAVTMSQPAVTPAPVVRPELAALLTGDTVIYTPRKSVEDILVESKMQAVEEYHRAKTQDKKMSFEEKVTLLEDKLLEEIGGTASEPSSTVAEYVEVLERVGEQQQKLRTATEPDGSWHLVYTSTPRDQYLSVPRWLNRFLTSSTCELDAKTIMYRVVFKLFSWLPPLVREQKGTLQTLDARKSIESLTRPVFTLGRLNLSKLFPFNLLLNRRRKPVAVRGPQQEERLSNECTFLGSNIKICRVTPVPIFGGEETVAIFARTVPEPTVSKAAAEALMAHKAIEPISKLFSKFGRRKRQIGYRLNGAQA